MAVEPRASKDAYVGCARGYLSLGRPAEAWNELERCKKHYGFSEGIFELMKECYIASFDWKGLVKFAHRTISEKGKGHAGAWCCLVLGLIRSEKPLLALRAAKSAQVNCRDSCAVRLESMRALVANGHLCAARTYFLESVALDADFQLLIAREADFTDFLRAYASGELSSSKSVIDPFADDGNEIR